MVLHHPALPKCAAVYGEKKYIEKTSISTGKLGSSQEEDTPVVVISGCCFWDNSPSVPRAAHLGIQS